MKTLERMMLEMLFDKKPEAPPTRTKKKGSGELTVKQFLKIMKNMPTFKKEFEEALKSLEPHKKKDESKLTIGQKWMLGIIASLTLPPLYILLMNALFTAVMSK